MGQERGIYEKGTKVGHPVDQNRSLDTSERKKEREKPIVVIYNTLEGIYEK